VFGSKTLYYVGTYPYSCLTNRILYLRSFFFTQIGLWSGIPHFTRFLFSLVLSFAIDSLMATGKYSRTCVRKISTTICTVVQALLIVALVYSGCDQFLVNGFLLLAMTASGASTSGPLSIMVDLSPNFASE